MTIYLNIALPQHFSHPSRTPDKRYSQLMLHRIGFTWQHGSPRSGELLPRLSILAQKNTERFISVALSLESPPPAVSRYSVLWCSDFPHPQKERCHTVHSREVSIPRLDVVVKCIFKIF